MCPLQFTPQWAREAPHSAPIAPAGAIKLGDFGISRALSTQTNLAETVCGTPYYLSPERCTGAGYSTPSDLWALGVVAYELLAMIRPFRAASVSALVTVIQASQRVGNDVGLP